MNGKESGNKDLHKEYYYHIRICIKPLMQKGSYSYSFDYKGTIGLKMIVDDYIVPYIKEIPFLFNGMRLVTGKVEQIVIFKSQASYFSSKKNAATQAKARLQVFNEESFKKGFLNSCVNITNTVCHKAYEKVEKEKNNQNSIKVKNTPLLFISHSKADYESGFVKELIKLLETIGLDKSNMFCSSHPSYWINEGDIYDALLSKFVNHNIFVLFVQSPRFFNSPISLNEMGAAWVLKTKYWSILTNDFEFKDMRGMANDSKITIKVDDGEAKYRLNNMRDCILEFFGLDDVDSNTWEYSKDNFLEAVCKIPREQHPLIEPPKLHHSK